MRQWIAHPARTTMNDAPSAFWDFSLRFYARPGVAAACLDIQEQARADVNVVLYLLFLATKGRQLAQTEVTEVDNLVTIWREQVVRPLRTARRHLKTVTAPFIGDAAGRLRNEIKRSELEAERIQQLTIEQSFPCATFGSAAASPAGAARANLDAYGAHIGGLPVAAARVLLENFNQS